MSDIQEKEPELYFDSEEDKTEGWMITFTDMTLLILVFFIFLFSLSTINKVRFQQSIYSVKKALKREYGGGIIPLETPNIKEGVVLSEAELIKKIIEEQHKVFADINFFFAQQGLEGKIGARLQNGKIILTVPSNIMFASGSVDLTSEGKHVLKKLKEFFVRHPDEKINICGYTDDTPVAPNVRFRDNWELSALRAVNVLRYLIGLGIDSTRLTATGYGEMNPLYPNTSEINRAKNRRVEFVLEKMIH